MASRQKADDYVLDPSRRKSVKAGPEERVRQSIIRHLITSLQVPIGLISVEKEIERSSVPIRADIVVYLRTGDPWMIVECKAPTVKISQSVFDQITRYNRHLKARYLLVSNGTDHFCCEWDPGEGSLSHLDRLPIYPSQNAAERL